jgi:acetamidase/formamidase
MTRPACDPLLYVPHDFELACTFGGRQPVARIHPGIPVRVFTEDCFGGQVRTIEDLPSQVCQPNRLNPVSGPFHVVGAEPGDTLAVHLVSITPARTFGFSATFPHFGALTSTRTTPSLQPPLPERVWRYDLDLDAETVRFTAQMSDYQVDLPLEPMIGTIGVAPPLGRFAALLSPTATAGTSTPRNCGRVPPCTCQCSSMGRCSRSVTGTPGRATGSSVGSRWRSPPTP